MHSHILFLLSSLFFHILLDEIMFGFVIVALYHLDLFPISYAETLVQYTCVNPSKQKENCYFGLKA